MPDLVNSTYEQARAVLVPFNTRITKVDKIDASKPGTVIDQSPKGGSPFAIDVTLTVSITPPAVPDEVGKTIGDAQSDLTKAGFTFTTVAVLDEQKPDGLVAAQDPAPGALNVATVKLNVYRKPVVRYLVEEPVVTGYTRNGKADTNGKTYEKSVSLGGGSSVEYNISRSYRRLLVDVGVEDTAPSSMVHRVSILGDGRVLFTADLNLGTSTPLDLDVTGVLRLKLETTLLSGANGNTVFGNIRLQGLDGEVPKK